MKNRIILLLGLVVVMECANACALKTSVEEPSIDKEVKKDGPPVVKIEVNPKEVKAGEQFTVTVSGVDDVGLETIWWFGDTKLPELNKAHQYGCNGAKKKINLWKLRIDTPGVYIFRANARDTVYGKMPGEPHQASEGIGIPQVELRVLGNKKANGKYNRMSKNTGS